MTNRWNVLESPEGARLEPPTKNLLALRLEYEGIVYSHNQATDEWTEFDAHIVPEEGEREQ